MPEQKSTSEAISDVLKEAGESIKKAAVGTEKSKFEKGVDKVQQGASDLKDALVDEVSELKDSTTEKLTEYFSQSEQNSEKKLSGGGNKPVAVFSSISSILKHFDLFSSI